MKHYDEGSLRDKSVKIHKSKTTEIKRDKEALRGSERNYRLLFENMKEGFFIAEPVYNDAGNPVDWRFLDANEAFAKMVGFPLGQIIGNLYGNLFPGGEQRWVDIIARVAETGEPESIEEYSELTGQWYCSRYYSPRPGTTASIALDITRIKSTEEELRKAEERYRALVSASSEVLYRMNPDWSQMLQLQSRGFLANTEGPNPNWLEEYVPPEEHPYVTAQIEKAIRDKNIFEMTHKVRREDGTTGCVISRAVPIFNDKGEIAEWFGAASDITELNRVMKELTDTNTELEDKVGKRTALLTTLNKSLRAEIEERKRTEEQLLWAQKNLRKVTSEIIFAEERSRQHFATDLHDTVVQTMGAAYLRSQLIQEEIPEKLQPFYKEMQEMISESITEARTIMAELSPPVLNELGLIPALEWLAEQVQKKRGLQVKFIYKGNNGDLSLPREIEILLFQATRELLMNIVKHAQAKRAIVKFFIIGRKARIEVSDNGKGFDVRKSFLPRETGGYGIYSIRERIRHIGGILAIQSSPGQGTKAIITTPLELEK